MDSILNNNIDYLMYWIKTMSTNLNINFKGYLLDVYNDIILVLITT